MDIMPIEGTHGVAPETQAPAGGFLGKEEFLNLLTTQMRHQDPLEPMDSAAMIAQLAQFSALEQMQNLNLSVQDGRREDGLMNSLFLEGQALDITLDSGRHLIGVVDRVSWIKNHGLTLDVAGELVPLRTVANMSLANVEPDGEESEP